MKDRTSFFSNHREGSNLHFGVREHAMTAITNGIQLHGGLHAYAATFFVFSDYMKPAIRLAALMGLPVTYILTHDSIGVGEDGPTHQPVDQLPMLRAVPNLHVFRPADAREVTAAWYSAITSKDHPTALVLSRQKLPVIEKSSKEALKGGYIVSEESGAPEVILVASGSEVSLALDAAKLISEKGKNVRVVSMPCMELFEAQTPAYRNTTLPKSVPTLAVEAASPLGWYKYADDVVAMESFGASAPGNELFDHFGFTAENVAARALKLIEE